MKDKVVTMKDGNGKTVDVRLDYSWVTLFFCFIPDLLRGNFKSCLIYIAVLAGTLFLLVGNTDTRYYFDPEYRELVDLANFIITLTCNFVYALVRNKALISFYLKEGYSFVGDVDKSELDTFMGYTINTNKIITE